MRLPRGAAGVLVVPPLAALRWPSLGVHQLQAVARARGHEVGVVYANVALAKRLGTRQYAKLANAPGDWLLGERLFARAAFGLPPLGRGAPAFLAQRADPNPGGPAFDAAELLAAERVAFELAEELGARLAEAHFGFVGVTTSFEQTACAAALLARVRSAAPDTALLLGGANCEGPMAQGLRSAGIEADVVFSGEAEASFARFLDGQPCGPIACGLPCTDLDALPAPDFDDWVDALAALDDLPPSERWLTWETSRGCWWGARHHCTFCGLNGDSLGFRAKSPEVAASQLVAISARHGVPRIALADNIMPHRYPVELMPRLEGAGVEQFWEVKANLDLQRLLALKAGGVTAIQPGIEALSTARLKRMDKGVAARQNVALLRNARCVGLELRWNLLVDLPSDRAEEYERTLALLPLLHHLPPPSGVVPLSLDRFSPYFARPEDFGIRDVRPLAAYADVFPAGTDLDALAYRFTGTWPSAFADRAELRGELVDAVALWRQRWRDPERVPTLAISEQAPGAWIAIDTRTDPAGAVTWLLPGQAQAAAVGGPLRTVPHAAWAIDRQLAVELDGWCVPLALAAPGVLRTLAGPAPDPVLTLR